MGQWPRTRREDASSGPSPRGRGEESHSSTPGSGSGGSRFSPPALDRSSGREQTPTTGSPYLTSGGSERLESRGWSSV